ncbi:MAG: alpha/beta hydrolase fold domain-containing protein [Muribaculaceae bacterium]|nr:alpha/beta hydrolase fold domain-containing protein [Muribaculaceae bacterium]
MIKIKTGSGIFRLALFFGSFGCSLITSAADDWAQFSRYQQDNVKVNQDTSKTCPKAVFIGNSITEGWVNEDPDFFTDQNFLGRGISGQTTYQMLVRFRDDVINLHPEIVVINGGTNDVAENNHIFNPQRTLGNIKSMAEIAEANGIKVILSSILPSKGFPWKDTVQNVAQKIILLNEITKEYADSVGYDFINYYPALVGDNGSLSSEFTSDGVHPNLKGYKVMESIALPVIEKNMTKEEVNKPVVIKLWKDDQPRFRNNLPQGAEKEENPDWITQVTDPELIVYPAEHPNGRVLVMCPGGGYYGLAIEHEGKALAPVLNENGITLAVLKYRMPNGNHEVPLEDVERSIDILKLHASEWGIDTKRIGIGGASAGGHLASTAAIKLSGKDNSPAFQMLLYPVITMQQSYTHPGSRELLLGPNPDDILVNKYSGELNVSTQTPPAFIAVSADDELVPVENSLLYVDSLRKKGIPVSLHLYPTGGHGWGFDPTFPYNQTWVNEMITWINKQ